MKSLLQLMGLLLTIIIVTTVIFWASAWQGRLVSEQQVTHALDVQGFTNCTIMKRDIYFVGWLGGGRDDDVRFQVMADNPRGKRVMVYVYAGWPFKAATIRSK